MTRTPTAPAALAGRRHDIDALRVCAFGLLILFHIGMFYVPWDWHVKSGHVAGWLELPMMLSFSSAWSSTYCRRRLIRPVVVIYSKSFGVGQKSMA